MSKDITPVIEIEGTVKFQLHTTTITEDAWSYASEEAKREFILSYLREEIDLIVENLLPISKITLK